MTSATSNLEPVAQQNAPDFIEMRGISKRFGGVRALTDVSFSIRSAEIHCLAGENGCGKSTLIKILSGVHAPDEGEILLEGKTHSIILLSVSATAFAAKRQQKRTVGNVV